MKNLLYSYSFSLFKFAGFHIRKNPALLLSLLIILFSKNTIAQVGIGTSTPQAFFHVVEDKDVLFGCDLTGSGKKLVWFGNKTAFRAGMVTSSQWHPINVGELSFAFGKDAQATNMFSIAMGELSKASGKGAVAIGNTNIASGENAIAMGKQSFAGGNYSVALGNTNSAIGDYSVALGYGSDASGDYSTALGHTTTTTGKYTTAIGFNSWSSGDYSVTLGSNCHTMLKKGSFAFGDATQVTNGEYLKPDQDNQMVMRFNSGYKLFTNYQATIGVALAHGGNAWTVLSDSTRKENFRKADGADFLTKISKMKLGSWNYKGQDVKTFRHYGPMAQDFFAAFGTDSLGTIGEAKSINQADFDGVNLIAIQALIQEVNLLKAELAASKRKESVFNARFEKIEAMLTERANQPALTFLP